MMMLSLKCKGEIKGEQHMTYVAVSLISRTFSCAGGQPALECLHLLPMKKFELVKRIRIYFKKRKSKSEMKMETRGKHLVLG